MLAETKKTIVGGDKMKNYSKAQMACLIKYTPLSNKKYRELGMKKPEISLLTEETIERLKRAKDNE